MSGASAQATPPSSIGADPPVLVLEVVELVVDDDVVAPEPPVPGVSSVSDLQPLPTLANAVPTASKPKKYVLFMWYSHPPWSRRRGPLAAAFAPSAHG
ncbi:MAG: hypothetical protein IT373_10645 [Polyangiaceae bacterium]|nr:hypothetical protein [Polyangiaceae bacterium]